MNPSHDQDPVTPPPDVLAAFLSGEATESERDLIRRWAVADPVNSEELSRLRGAWQATSLNSADTLQLPHERAWNLLRDRIERKAEQKTLRIRRLALAAAIVLTAGLAGGLAVIERWPGAPVPAPQVFAAPLGQRGEITLADGTRVVLFPGSTLRLPRPFTDDRRDVELVGRAYFDVREDAKRPFTIAADSTRVTVLGTRFVVDAEPHRNRTTVAVESGRVQVSAFDSDTALELTAGEVSVRESGGPVRRSPELADDALSWVRGELRFRAVSVAEAAREIGRWYGVEFQVADSGLARRVVTLSLHTEGADVASAILARIAGAEIVRGVQGITLIPRTAAPRSTP